MKHFILALALIALLASVSSAATVTYGPSNVSLQSTSWTAYVFLQKFDPSLGTLNSIKFEIGGHVEGTARFESLDASATTVTMDLQAELKLQRPDLTTLVVTIPVASTVTNATAFDGVIDFGGTSGKTWANLTADKSETATTTSAADKALFTGAGLIQLPVSATGQSAGSGAGNLVLQFQTLAAGSAWVTYDYTPVPEPSSLLGLAGLLSPIGFVIRRRK